MTERQPSFDKVPEEVTEILHDAANQEDLLRSNGVSPRRISKLVHTPMMKQLIQLRLKGIDTRLAFVPELTESPAEAVRDIEPELTESQERDVIRLMDTTGLSRYDAVRIILNR